MADTSGTSRSEFLKHAAGAAVIVAGAGTGAGVLAESAAATVVRRKRARKYLELDGVNLGELIDASGGDAGFEVVVGDINKDGFAERSLGGPTSSEFTIVLVSNMDIRAYNWVKDALDNGTAAKQVRGGGIRFVDKGPYDERRAFTNPVITSVTMPALDNAPEVLPGITVTFVAATVSDEPSGGTSVSGIARATPWQSRNFRLNIPGLGGRVASVDSFTWTLPQLPTGSTAVVETPILSCSVTDDDGSWAAWYDKYAAAGDQSDVRNGTLRVKEPTHPPPRLLLSWGFTKLRLFTLQPDLSVPSGLRLRAEMCCDRCTLSVAPPSAA